MIKFKRLTIALAALFSMATGAWAQTENEVTVTPDGNNKWTLTMPAGNVTLNVEYEPEFTATFKALTANTIGTAATVKLDNVAIDTLSAEKNKLNGIYEGQTITLTAQTGYKFRSVTATKGSAAAATPLDNTTTAWTAGTYEVPAGGVTYSDAITVSGDVTLVLTDGETLTLNKGISIADGATLTIEGNGTMNVNGTSNSPASTVAGTGTLVLTSGTLTAKGGNGANVGGTWFSNIVGNAGGAAINGNVTVSGGTLTAIGGNGGSGGACGTNIICGDGGAAINGSVTISSGTLNATGGNGGRACYDVDMGDYSDYHGNGTNVQGGAGGSAIGGTLTINGGTLTTTDGTNGTVSGSDNKDCSGGAGGKAVGGTTTDNR